VTNDLLFFIIVYMEKCFQSTLEPLCKISSENSRRVESYQIAGNLKINGDTSRLCQRKACTNRLAVNTACRKVYRYIYTVLHDISFFTSANCVKLIHYFIRQFYKPEVNIEKHYLPRVKHL